MPAHIPRPEYVGKAGPAPNTWPDVQPPEVIEAMRVAGRIAAQALAAGGAAVAPGVTTDEIDRVVHEFLLDHGAYPSTLGYKGFPKSCCTCLNEVICHGIPDTTVIEDGDIVNIDVTAFIGGVHGDTNATFLAGDVDEESRLLVERTREATMRAIKAVRPGRELYVVGRVIETYAKRFGYGVVRDFTGHGIGRSFHGGLVVLHYDDPTVHIPLEPGMTFTIEPMITVGSSENEMWADGWTVVTARRLAHGAVRAHAAGHRPTARRSSPCPDPCDRRGMAKVYERIDAKLAAFIEAQPLFFVATAPLAADGLVNVSPKGTRGTFAVLDAHTFAYLDLTGSGVETVAHLRENGRICVMFCAFDGGPNIVRLHGTGRVVFRDDPGVRARRSPRSGTGRRGARRPGR